MALGLQLYWKETPAPFFSCEIGEIVKNTYFEEYVQTTVSNWLELMAKSLSFLKCFISKRRLFISFNISENLRENQNA